MWNRLSDILGREKDPQQPGSEKKIGNNTFPSLKVERGIGPSDVKIAQNRLRMLEVEGEIVRDTIRRLYEAEAEGKISESELKSLVGRYKERLIQVEGEIEHDKSVLALYDLERIQVDLMELFNKHFNDLNTKIEKLKARLGMESAPTTTFKEKKEIEQNVQKREKKAKPEDKEPSLATEKSEADKRIEKIQIDIEKTLEKLNQIEIEA